MKSTNWEKASTETIKRRHTHVKKAYYQVKNKAMCTYSPGKLKKVKSAFREKASTVKTTNALSVE